MKMPQAVVFDIGKVLVDFDFQRAADALSPLSRLSPQAFRQLIDQSPLLHRYETGLMSTEQFYHEIRTRSGFQGALDEFGPRFANIFSEIPEMIELHAEFRRQGIPSYIFSNTNELAVGWIRQTWPFFSGFDGYVFSFEVGAMKPHEPIYQAVERISGHTGDALFYLDDRPENVATAVSRGWQAHVHSDAAATRRLVEETFGW